MDNQLKFMLYKSEQDDTSANVIIKDETIWITQKEMAKLFEVTPANINQHLKNIYESGELDEISTIKKFLIVQKEGTREVSPEITHYNLDAIISVL